MRVGIFKSVKAAKLQETELDRIVYMEQQGQVSVSPNKEERLKIDNYEEVIISSHK